MSVSELFRVGLSSNSGSEREACLGILTVLVWHHVFVSNRTVSLPSVKILCSCDTQDPEDRPVTS